MAFWVWLLGLPLALLAALVLLVFLVKLVSPWSFMKIKKPPGFVLHAVTGGHVPPYFTDWPFREEYFKKVFRDGDVVVCSMAKGGTTWLLNIVHQLRTLGDPKGMWKDVNLTTPWPECMWYPGQQPDDAWKAWQSEDGFASHYPFRVLKSHYKPLNEKVSWSKAWQSEEIVPVRKHPGVKYIVCYREGKDVVDSFYPFFAHHNPAFKDVWGQFPPTFPDFKACFDFFSKEQKGFYHGYASLWWPYRHDPNVLTLHYADLKREPRKQMQRIADFVGVSVPASAWPAIEKKVSLEWMKEKEELFKYVVPGSPFGKIMGDKPGSMVRSGKVGGGKQNFTPEMDAVWEKLNDGFFGPHPGLKEWVLTGGPLPPLTEAERRSGAMDTPLLRK